MSSIFDTIGKYEERIVYFLRGAYLGEYEGIRLQDHPQMQLFFNTEIRIGSNYLVSLLLEIYIDIEGEIRFDTTLFPEFPVHLRKILESPLFQSGAVSEERIQLQQMKLKLAEQGVITRINSSTFSDLYCTPLEDGNYKREIARMIEIAENVSKNLWVSKFKNKANF